MENMTYKLSDFEGPLDLLLALIEKNKMNILDISISTICDQYLEFLAQAEQMDMDVATDFLEMASKLMVWKSAEMIPHEEEAEKPPRFDLSDILIRHQHAKEAAPKMHPLYAYYSNRMVKDTDEISPDRTYVADQKVEDLITAVRRINTYRETMEKAKTNFTPMVSKPIVPVEGKIVIILNTLETFGTASLRELLVDAPSLADMIASFMGVLELIKIRKILIEETTEAESDSVHGESTRFFINPDASDVESTEVNTDFASTLEPEPTKAGKSK
ncbi:MAG: segregation/condensation protein A [Clostridia bacterium]|nr:segregation/condensation protein A [Clostridia bacterium]